MSDNSIPDFPFASQDECEKVQKMVGVLASMPPPKKQPLITTPTETCACGKKVFITELQDLDTGVFVTLNDICKGCRDGEKIDRQLARVVCAGCKRVITRIKPGKDKTGFSFVAGKTYHVSECSLCNPDVQRCPIIEKILWDRNHSAK